MHKILVPLDGSELSSQVLPYVRALATSYTSQIQLLHIISTAQRKQFFAQHPEVLWTTDEAPLEDDPIARNEPDERMLDVIRSDAEAHFEPLLQELRATGLDVTRQIVFGTPAGCILEFAQNNEADMIAMATHGYSGIRRWTLGSITDKVVHATHKPIFVVRGSSEPLSQSVLLRRVLVPLDGSSFSRQALPVATELALRNQATVHLITASTTHTQEKAEQHLEAAVAELRQQGLDVSSHAVDGYPAEIIIDEAEKQHSDVIVMATHGYSGLQRWTLGSVADKVLHATTTPLLLIRPEQRHNGHDAS